MTADRAAKQRDGLDSDTNDGPAADMALRLACVSSSRGDSPACITTDSRAALVAKLADLLTATRAVTPKEAVTKALQAREAKRPQPGPRRTIAGWRAT